MSDEIKEVTVHTKGKAFLRNGPSQVIAVGVYPLYGSQIQISATNSRGNETRGYIRMEAVDFARLCRSFLELNPNLLPPSPEQRVNDVLVELGLEVAGL